MALKIGLTAVVVFVTCATMAYFCYKFGKVKAPLYHLIETIMEISVVVVCVDLFCWAVSAIWSIK